MTNKHATSPEYLQANSFDYKVLTLIIFLIIFEGSLGKWMNTTLEYIAIVCRDLAAITLITRAVLNRNFRRHPRLTTALGLWTILVITWSAIQLAVEQFNPLITVVGLRFWILYLWLSLAIASTITFNEYEKLCDVVVMLLLAMTPLALLQSFSSKDSFINKSNDDYGLIFTIGGDTVRTTGTFSFTLGFTCFVAWATAIALSSDNSKLLRGPPVLQRVIILSSTLVAILLSGSRAAIIFGCFIFALSFIVEALVLRQSNEGKIGATLFVLIIGIIAVPLLFSDFLTEMTDRFISADAIEDPDARVLQMFFGNLSLRDDLSFFGKGLGMTANLSGLFFGSERTFLLSEVEPERILLAGGFLGFVWLCSKFILGFAGFAHALQVLFRTGTSRSILLWTTTLYGTIGWAISGQLSAHAIGHMLLAFSLMSIGITGDSYPKTSPGLPES